MQRRRVRYREQVRHAATAERMPIFFHFQVKNAPRTTFLLPRGDRRAAKAMRYLENADSSQDRLVRVLYTLVSCVYPARGICSGITHVDNVVGVDVTGALREYLELRPQRVCFGVARNASHLQVEPNGRHTKRHISTTRAALTTSGYDYSFRSPGVH